jgi:hypothetical protein
MWGAYPFLSQCQVHHVSWPEPMDQNKNLFHIFDINLAFPSNKREYKLHKLFSSMQVAGKQGCQKSNLK